MADGDDDDPRNFAIPACPGCGSSQIYARMTVTPKYRCTGCGHEFPEPTRRRTGEGPKSQG